jgi:acyl-CoA thioesterase
MTAAETPLVIDLLLWSLLVFIVAGTVATVIYSVRLVRNGRSNSSQHRQPHD